VSLPYPSMDAVPFTPLTAAFLDQMIANIEALAAGTGQNATSISATKFTNPYKFRAIKAADQTITSNTLTTVVYATEQFDTNNNFASNTYTVPVSGFYYLAATMMTNTVAGLVQGGAIGFTKNTSTVIAQIQEYDNGVSYDYWGRSISGLYQLTAGDTVIVQVILQTTGSVNLLGNFQNSFSGFLVSVT
jgi:hypothetical protein